MCKICLKNNIQRFIPKATLHANEILKYVLDPSLVNEILEYVFNPRHFEDKTNMLEMHYFHSPLVIKCLGRRLPWNGWLLVVEGNLFFLELSRLTYGFAHVYSGHIYFGDVYCSEPPKCPQQVYKTLDSWLHELADSQTEKQTWSIQEMVYLMKSYAKKS